MQSLFTEVKLCVECGRERKGKHKLCYSCRTRRRRGQDPVWAVYYILRSNAKRRGVKFALTFDWFRDFILGPEGKGYMEKRGQGAQDLTLDRKVNSLGYVDGNLQVLTRIVNTRKGQSDWGHGLVHRDPNCPF